MPDPGPAGEPAARTRPGVRVHEYGPSYRTDADGNILCYYCGRTRADHDGRRLFVVRTADSAALYGTFRSIPAAETWARAALRPGWTVEPVRRAG